MIRTCDLLPSEAMRRPVVAVAGSGNARSTICWIFPPNRQLLILALAATGYQIEGRTCQIVTISECHLLYRAHRPGSNRRDGIAFSGNAGVQAVEGPATLQSYQVNSVWWVTTDHDEYYIYAIVLYSDGPYRA
jgi:hypothetical protein